jgi:hypothetical protein
MKLRTWPSALWGGRVRRRRQSRLRGQKAVNVVFGVDCTGDVLLKTALGLCRPQE